MALDAMAVTKQKELEDALKAADSAGEVVSQDVPLRKSTHAATGIPGFDLILHAPDLVDADVAILKHEPSGIVQFFFPGDTLPTGAHSLKANPSAVGKFGFLPAMHLEMSGVGQDGWKLVSGLRIFERTAEKAILEIARVVEANKKKEGLIPMLHGYTPTTDAELENRLALSKGKRVLLFVHGIFSSIEGGFHGLGQPDGAPGQVPGALGGTLKELLDRYQNHVFGYDHWTISKTPLENARALIEAIPAGSDWTVDLVCHSRGGLVTRALFADPADNEHLQMPELREIRALRNGRISAVGKVIFVAGANQGSALANPEELKKFLKLAGVLASKSHCFALDVVIGLLRTLVAAAFEVPSVEQLDRARSKLIGDLNAIGSAIGSDGAYGVRANFDRGGWEWKEAIALVEKWLMPELNDLVVPYEGVALNPHIPESRLRSFEPDASQSAVWHTNYFEHASTHDFLKQHLA